MLTRLSKAIYNHSFPHQRQSQPHRVTALISSIEISIESCFRCQFEGAICDPVCWIMIQLVLPACQSKLLPEKVIDAFASGFMNRKDRLAVVTTVALYIQKWMDKHNHVVSHDSFCMDPKCWV